VSYDTYLSVTLTALAVFLAVVGILVGLLAVWGYKTICEEAGRVASEKAEAAIAGYLSGQKIGEQLKGLVLEHVQREGDRVYDDLSVTGQADETKLGKEYPGEKPTGEQR